MKQWARQAPQVSDVRVEGITNRLQRGRLADTEDVRERFIDGRLCPNERLYRGKVAFDKEGEQQFEGEYPSRQRVVNRA